MNTFSLASEHFTSTYLKKKKMPLSFRQRAQDSPVFISAPNNVPHHVVSELIASQVLYNICPTLYYVGLPLSVALSWCCCLGRLRWSTGCGGWADCRRAKAGEDTERQLVVSVAVESSSLQQVSRAARPPTACN